MTLHTSFISKYVFSLVSDVRIKFYLVSDRYGSWRLSKLRHLNYLCSSHKTDYGVNVSHHTSLHPLHKGDDTLRKKEIKFIFAHAKRLVRSRRLFDRFLRLLTREGVEDAFFELFNLNIVKTARWHCFD